MTGLPVQHVDGRDGVRLAYRELGRGRPVVLLHGYLSTAAALWVDSGHAATIAARGYRVIMPDLRGHGDSGKPHDPAAYPPDVLADDGLALLDHLGLTDYDLGGYSLGGRTVLRMLARGAVPGRAVVAGMGLDAIVHARTRGAGFRPVLADPGSGPAALEEFLASVDADRVALGHVLGSYVDTPREAIAAIAVPTLVLVGDEDGEVGSAEALAAALPHARYAVIPGDHARAATAPELATAITAFLGRWP